MSIIEYETWTIKEGVQEAHDDMIRRWFAYVQEHHLSLFFEWKSAKYYRFVDRNGQPTGRYLMLFEFISMEGLHAYKERRKNWDGPYEEYKKYDPYQYFNIETVTTEYWEPLEQDLWLDFTVKEDFHD